MRRQCLRETSPSGIRRSQSSRRPTTVTSRGNEKLRRSPSALNITSTTCISAHLITKCTNSGQRSAIPGSFLYAILYAELRQEQNAPLYASEAAGATSGATGLLGRQTSGRRRNRRRLHAAKAISAQSMEVGNGLTKSIKRVLCVGLDVADADACGDAQPLPAPRHDHRLDALANPIAQVHQRLSRCIGRDHTEAVPVS